MRYTLHESDEFAAVREELFQGDEPFRRFQNTLMANPRAGDVIPGTHGARKVRWADPRRSKGKRSGIRVIYYLHEERDRILLLYAYDKNVADLTPKQKAYLGNKILEFRAWRERMF